ncbi:hypothetical protein [Larkinella soli]|nr:hypothetical protein [Larkinella soli]
MKMLFNSLLLLPLVMLLIRLDHFRYLDFTSSGHEISWEEIDGDLWP